jgi:glycosyltransferase involved in cell wall biosynthesis
MKKFAAQVVRSWKKKRVCWITSNYYIDVDLPIVPAISKYYDIDWQIIHNKNANCDYMPRVEELAKETNIKYHFHYLQNRRRNFKIINEYLRILRIIKKDRYDFYYFDIDGLPFFFPLVSLIFNRNKVICAAHHVTTPLGAVNYKYAKLYMGFILKYFKYFQVFSKNQYNILHKKYPAKKAFYAPLALINFGKSESVLPKDRIVFLFFGYIRDYKRLDILICAANKLYETTNKKFKIKIFGYCSEWEKYEKLIKYPEIFELRIESIKNKEIPSLFKESHYFVMPYQDLAQSAALMVAFNYYLPVIASDIDSLKEFIADGKNGFLFEKGSIDSLSSVMLGLLDRSEEGYLQIKQNVIEYVDKNYSIDSIIRLYVDYFESIEK